MTSNTNSTTTQVAASTAGPRVVIKSSDMGSNPAMQENAIRVSNLLFVTKRIQIDSLFILILKLIYYNLTYFISLPLFDRSHKRQYKIITQTMTLHLPYVKR